MPSAFEWARSFAPSGLLPAALLSTALGILLPLAFILGRRAWRRRYFQRRERRTLEIRAVWPQILDGRYPAEKWRFDPLSRDIVESILLDQLEVAPPAEAERLRASLRASGLLDMRIWEARQQRGWRRRNALVSLGRMRAPEGILPLAEALDDSDAETRMAAVRGLGNMGFPQAGEQLLLRLEISGMRIPERPVQNALLRCCREDPWLLVPYLRKADDRLRPVLARVLGEVATSDLEEDLVALASDPLPEVRASAARALGEAKPRLALNALSNLARDEEWFVRLRAVVAMGEMHDPHAIPVLIGTLCDPNRHVRIRSAAALARFDGHIRTILEDVMKSRDRYALQALVSELERSGRILALVDELRDPQKRAAAEEALLAAVRAGAHRLLLDALVRHDDWRARLDVARLLARSQEPQLIAPLERLTTTAGSRRQQRVLRWVLEKLRAATPAQQPDGVPA